MSGEIKAGDLVMVIRARLCCPQFSVYGNTFRVEAIEHIRGLECPHCKMVIHVAHVLPAGEKGWYAMSRLIRIDPPAITESVTERKEVTA